MAKRSPALLVPIVVTVMDVLWGWVLSAFIRPWLILLLSPNPVAAAQLVDQSIEPRLWISYVMVLAAQLTWVNVLVPRYPSMRLLRQLWWIGCLLIATVSLLVHHDLVITPEPELLIVAVQLADLVLLYWLTTRLLTPLPQRRVIPGWW